MTMLDRMRRHKNWLKWSLAIVVRGVHPALHPELPAQRPAPAPRHARRRRIGRGPGRSRSASSAASTSSRCRPTAAPTAATSTSSCSSSSGIDQRILQQMIDEEAALAEADRLGHHGERRGSARADPRAACVPGERAVHRRRSATGSCCRCRTRRSRPSRVRGTGPPQHDAREAAGRADRLDDGVGQGSRRRNTSSATRR